MTGTTKYTVNSEIDEHSLRILGFCCGQISRLFHSLLVRFSLRGFSCRKKNGSGTVENVEISPAHVSPEYIATEASFNLYLDQPITI